jgi:hypothetical protein
MTEDPKLEENAGEGRSDETAEVQAPEVKAKVEAAPSRKAPEAAKPNLEAENAALKGRMNDIGKICDANRGQSLTVRQVIIMCDQIKAIATA